MKIAEIIIRLVLAWIAFLAAQIATGMLIHPKTPPNPNPLLFLMVSSAFIVLAIGAGPLPRTAENPLRATLLPNGNVLASGTNCSYSGCGHVPTATCFLYTTSTNSWSVTGKLNQPRIDHTSTLLLNGKVLIAGGLDRGLGTGISILRSAELYTP